MKCTGKCGRESPDKYDSGKGFGSYTWSELVEWVCPECWAKGVRHEAWKKHHPEKLPDFPSD